MILKGSQRSGGIQLAKHLLNVQDNEHVDVHDVRGFVSDDVFGAFKETHAISQGTKCSQYLFSLSLSPPETVSVPIEIFESAIQEIETKLDLVGQPRVIVFHEKGGRRHAHCVWSRIDVGKMKAINLSHFKLKLKDVSRQLYLENNWHMPKGLMNLAERNPLNFTVAEWQQAKRTKQDPRVIKQIFQDCWKHSDSADAFANALSEHGFHLAKGTRRDYVAVDWHGEVYSIARWAGIKAKAVRNRLADDQELPNVDAVIEKLVSQLSTKYNQHREELEMRFSVDNKTLVTQRSNLTAQHRKQRDELKEVQSRRHIAETKARSKRLPTGMKALWFRITGQYKKVIAKNELELEHCSNRDISEKNDLVKKQLLQRRKLQHEFQKLRHHQSISIKKRKQVARTSIEMLKSSPPKNRDRKLDR